MIQTEEFRNQTVLITGASAGIGAAAAQAFGSRGAHVIVHYNSRREAAEQVVKAIQAAGGTGETVQADLGTKKGLRASAGWLAAARSISWSTTPARWSAAPRFSTSRRN